MEAAKVLTDSFRHLAESEYEKLRTELERLRARSRELEEELESVRLDAHSHESTIREIEDLLGIAPQLRLDLSPAPIRGKALREVAVETLIAKSRNEVVHYRDWYDLVVDAGYEVSGQNPVATFLAQVSQDERVERVGNKSGKYRLRPQ